MNTRKIYRINEVSDLTGLTKSSIYKQIRLQKFPKGVKITDRSIGWPSDLIDTWLTEKIEGGIKS
jgi:prophage regulatory protein